MKFSCIVGNPPYQGQGGSQSQIYPVFYLWARKNCDQMSMIFPSAWQDPKSGNGLKSMNTPEIKYDKLPSTSVRCYYDEENLIVLYSTGIIIIN